MGAGDEMLASWVASCLLLSLRIAPTFLFAPPFTLVRMPRQVLALIGLGLAAILVSANPGARLHDVSAAALASAALGELMLGLVPLLALQLMFSALYVTGRTIDIQSGYALALLIDPTSRTQTPLVGTLFAYIAGASFFALDGHMALFRLWSAQLQVLPIGAAVHLGSVAVLGDYMFTISLAALGVGGAAILALFLTDIVVAMLSRTVPQLNALLLGIQVKAILLLAVLPLAFGASAALYTQLVARALEAMKRLA